MNAILKKELVIDRPIVFLCGPYYNGKNPNDRRALLRTYFKDDLDDRVLPLIIDDFLSKENLVGFDLKLPLLEEILARISRKTLIFLDTISAASEMGLFMNHAFKNKSLILLPKESDIVENHVGAFAQSIIDQNDNAKRLHYRPSITLYTAATGYTSELYGFINNIIPYNLAEYLKGDPDLQGYKEEWRFAVEQAEGALIVKMPARQLFYIVTSVVYDKYYKVLRTPGTCDDTLFNCDEIIELVNNAISHYLIDYTDVDVAKKLSLRTEFDENLENIVYHMVSFVFIYHKRAAYRGIQIIADQVNRSIVYYSGKNPHEVFNISQKEFALLRESYNNPDLFFDRTKVKVNGKKRELVKYTSGNYGENIRSVHKKILYNLNNEYEQHRLSFAYKAGASIKKCAEVHINSHYFVKYDISKFFNSIDLKILTQLFMQEFQIDNRYKALTKQYIETFFVRGILPLGLVLSPILSDIYMKDFDKNIEDRCNLYGWRYTRYADDFLISSGELIDKDEENSTETFIKELLSEKRLGLNDQKKQHVLLDHEGKFLKYIGIFIINSTNGNYLSVGRRYINQVAKEILDYRDDRARLPYEYSIEADRDLIYRRQRLIGKIGFLKTIEGNRGIRKLASRLKNHMTIDSERFID